MRSCYGSRATRELYSPLAVWPRLLNSPVSNPLRTRDVGIRIASATIRDSICWFCRCRLRTEGVDILRPAL